MLTLKIEFEKKRTTTTIKHTIYIQIILISFGTIYN